MTMLCSAQEGFELSIRTAAAALLGCILACVGAASANAAGAFAHNQQDSAPPLQDQPPPIPAPAPVVGIIGEYLVVGEVGTIGRVAVRTDAVEHARIVGRFERRQAGDEVINASGQTRAWRVVQAAENGVVTAPELRNGYALAYIESPAETVVMLSAAGHAWVEVNGSPRAGNPYRLGLGALPIKLQEGTNELLFRVSRGVIRAELSPAPRQPFLSDTDTTAPDVYPGMGPNQHLAVVLTNPQDAWASRLSIRATMLDGDAPVGDTIETPVDRVPPLGVVKAPVRFTAGAAADPAVSLQLHAAGEPIGEPLRIALRAVAEDRPHRRTFVSEIDGSVQFFAVNPRVGGERGGAMVLTLHGASVDALAHASAYAPKPDAWIIAPTNRRPFGFDWEDWGRLDAMEVMDIAQAEFGTDPRRVYLTGHSMGGHGVWRLASLYPDRFAAAGPSAGWIDFWSYGGAAWYDTPDSIESVLNTAHGLSRTLALRDNLLGLPVYILHGEADTNVPVGQARRMHTLLQPDHPRLEYHEQPGAGHWWGTQCVDWPPMFEFFAESQTPSPGRTRLDFTTPTPAVSADHRWVSVLRQARSLHPSRVSATADPEARRVALNTENVLGMAVRLDGLAEANGLGAGEPWQITLDGAVIAKDASGEVIIEGGRVVRSLSPGKRPDRAGPLKAAWTNRPLLVVGTLGNPSERRWALQKARFDAETFWYRGNGRLPIMLDTEFDPAAHPDRNIVLYGNSETNSAWDALIDGEVRLERGVFGLDGRTIDSTELAVLFVRPRKDSATASVAVIGGTGVRGEQAATHAPLFVSGIHWPDWIVYDGEMLLEGTPGILGTGFFGPDWSYDPEQSAWGEP